MATKHKQKAIVDCSLQKKTDYFDIHLPRVPTTENSIKESLVAVFVVTLNIVIEKPTAKYKCS